ncbi:MAG: tetratricopeptide repeat protein [Bacteroidales bacterium]|nr:tetratricopeptide repeat protein [Bacteroidales bacterium]
MKLLPSVIFYLLLLVQGLFGQGLDEYKQGIAMMAKENYTGAVEMYNIAINLNKNNSKYYINRGLALYELGQIDEAIKDFITANTLQINSANYLLARCYAAKDDLGMTLKYLEENLKGRDKVLYYEVVKDRIFYNFLEESDWLDFWEKEWFDDYQKVLNEAGFLMNSHDFYDAIEYLDNALSKKLQGHEIYAMRALCYKELGNNANAIEDYTEAINLNPKTYEYYNKRAELYVLTGKPKKAIDDFRQSVKIENTQVPLYFQLAKLENQEKMYPEALKSIQNFLAYNSSDIEGMYIGGVIYRNNGEYLKALEYLNKVLDISPSKAEYFQARGETYLSIKSNDFLEYAINDFSMALDLKPNNPAIYLKRAEANYKYKKFNEACFDIEQAIKLGSLEAITMKETYCLSNGNK